ncbi:MAG: FecR family protein [Elusimicrobia bacterium]|nr:FecR family protein [Elusimicrobiota bacterium]MBU2614032.1 FecR family protein [Elusimicrobiota bacterium]
MKNKLMVIAVCLSMCASYVFSAKIAKVVVSESRGKVTVKINKSSGWIKCYPGMLLDENATIKTDSRSKATIILYDGSRISVNPKSELLLKTLTDGQKVLEQKSGKIRFKIAKLLQGRTFECKTPTAVCSIRGTDFTLDVNDNNETELKVFEGLVAAAKLDGTGGEFHVGASQKMSFVKDLPPNAPTSFSGDDNKDESNSRKEEMKLAVKAEINMDLSQEAVQQMAAQEMKLAQYQEGKTVIDVFGKRVRIEEYLVRGDEVGLQPNQVKLVVVNSRKDRFDWYQRVATFNDVVPADMKLATKWMDWTKGATLPSYYTVANDMGASNTVDNIKYGNAGGSIVAGVDDPWQLQYTNFYFKIKDSTMYNGAPLAPVRTVYPDKIEDVVPGFGSGMITTTFPDGDKMHSKQDTTFSGISYSEDYYSLDDYGKVPDSETYLKDPMKYNMEAVFKYDNFTGKDKKIDLCVAPKLFTSAGIK